MMLALSVAVAPIWPWLWPVIMALQIIDRGRAQIQNKAQAGFEIDRSPSCLVVL
jgi:hypothetical protein